MSSFSLFFASMKTSKQLQTFLFVPQPFPRLNTVVKLTQHRVIMVSTNFLSSSISSSFYSWRHYSLLVLIIVCSVSARVFFSSSAAARKSRELTKFALLEYAHTNTHDRLVRAALLD